VVSQQLGGIKFAYSIVSESGVVSQQLGGIKFAYSIVSESGVTAAGWYQICEH